MRSLSAVDCQSDKLFLHLDSDWTSPPTIVNRLVSAHHFCIKSTTTYKSIQFFEGEIDVLSRRIKLNRVYCKTHLISQRTLCQPTDVWDSSVLERLTLVGLRATKTGFNVRKLLLKEEVYYYYVDWLVYERSCRISHRFSHPEPELFLVFSMFARLCLHSSSTAWLFLEQARSLVACWIRVIVEMR